MELGVGVGFRSGVAEPGGQQTQYYEVRRLKKRLGDVRDVLVPVYDVPADESTEFLDANSKLMSSFGLGVVRLGGLRKDHEVVRFSSCFFGIVGWGLGGTNREESLNGIRYCLIYPLSGAPSHHGWTKLSGEIPHGRN